MGSGFPELCVGMSQEEARPQTSPERVLGTQASGGHAEGDFSIYVARFCGTWRLYDFSLEVSVIIIIIRVN